jgi:hypothetical protein
MFKYFGTPWHIRGRIYSNWTLLNKITDGSFHPPSSVWTFPSTLILLIIQLTKHLIQHPKLDSLPSKIHTFFPHCWSTRNHKAWGREQQYALLTVPISSVQYSSGICSHTGISNRHIMVFSKYWSQHSEVMNIIIVEPVTANTRIFASILS